MGDVRIDWEELLTCPCGRFRFSPVHLLGRVFGICEGVDRTRLTLWQDQPNRGALAKCTRCGGRGDLLHLTPGGATHVPCPECGGSGE